MDQFGSIQSHRFLEVVLSVAGFKLYFHSWIHLLYTSLSAMVEANVQIHQGFPFSPLLYVLAQEPFLCRLRVSLILNGIMLPDATTSARYMPTQSSHF